MWQRLVQPEIEGRLSTSRDPRRVTFRGIMSSKNYQTKVWPKDSFVRVVQTVSLSSDLTQALFSGGLIQWPTPPLTWLLQKIYSELCRIAVYGRNKEEQSRLERGSGSWGGTWVLIKQVYFGLTNVRVHFRYINLCRNFSLLYIYVCICMILLRQERNNRSWPLPSPPLL